MNAQILGRDARINLRFFLEMAGAVIVLAAAKFAARHIPVTPGTAAYMAVQLLPVPAIWLLPLVNLRHYLRIDELQQLQFLQAIALTAGILAGVAWSLPSLHIAFGWNGTDSGLWEVHFSVVYVAVTALVNVLRMRPR